MIIEGLTVDENRAVDYWTNCVKAVAKSHNIDLQYFIDALILKNDKEKQNQNIK